MKCGKELTQLDRGAYRKFVNRGSTSFLCKSCLAEKFGIKVRECYEKIGSDFDKVLGRMGSEALVKRFAVKFLEDKSFEELTESLKEKDGEDAFRAAHTLKGICANLGLDRLYEIDSELTEKLRGRQTEGSEELYQKVAEVYETTVTVLKELDNF